MRQSERFALLVILTLVIDAVLIVLPPGLSILDLRLYYGADEAVALLADLGQRGRTEYFVHECIDLGFIALYTMLLGSLAERWHLRSRLVRALVFAPGVADILETTGILALLATYPSGPRLLATAIGYFTLFKWAGFLAVTMAMLIARIRR